MQLAVAHSAQASISVNGGCELYSFPPQSAGPFGEDIVGEWMNADDLFNLLVAKKMGWRDMHATSLVRPDPTSGIQKSVYAPALSWMDIGKTSAASKKRKCLVEKRGMFPSVVAKR